MNANDYIWWIGAGVLVVAELLTGTFYLLMIALGFLAGALVHLAGSAPAVQYAVAALVALAAVITLRRSRFGHRKARRDAASNPDVHPDIGAAIEVLEWRDGHARVPYRGALWDVELAPGARADARRYEITAVHGNRLVVAEKKPSGPGAAHHPLSTTKE
ncbi:MAG: NfeD family protein [Trinickia sp.]|uniref:NfeD family protein n=1 Tax=Trinickia sp. TaxID=2571163 RepID=UPI003F81A6C7